MAVSIKKQKTFVAGRGYSKEDWDSVDSPELTEDELAAMVPAKAMLPPAFFDGLADARRQRGRPRKDTAKEAVTLRLDPDIVDLFKAGGSDWRTRMSEALRKAASSLDGKSASK